MAQAGRAALPLRVQAHSGRPICRSRSLYPPTSQHPRDGDRRPLRFTCGSSIVQVARIVAAALSPAICHLALILSRRHPDMPTGDDVSVQCVNPCELVLSGIAFAWCLSHGVIPLFNAVLHHQAPSIMACAVRTMGLSAAVVGYPCVRIAFVPCGLLRMALDDADSYESAYYLPYGWRRQGRAQRIVPMCTMHAAQPPVPPILPL